MDERPDYPPVHVTAKIEGIVLPAWFAISLAVAAVTATIALFFCWTYIQILTHEIRILQLHTADMENVLIRQGVATRQDFAQWSASAPPLSPPSPSPSPAPSPASPPSTPIPPKQGKE